MREEINEWILTNTSWATNNEDQFWGWLISLPILLQLRTSSFIHFTTDSTILKISWNSFHFNALTIESPLFRDGGDSDTEFGDENVTRWKTLELGESRRECSGWASHEMEHADASTGCRHHNPTPPVIEWNLLKIRHHKFFCFISVKLSGDLTSKVIFVVPCILTRLISSQFIFMRFSFWSLSSVWKHNSFLWKRIFLHNVQFWEVFTFFFISKS